MKHELQENSILIMRNQTVKTGGLEGLNISYSPCSIVISVEIADL